jgi:hypothetical protein
MMERGRRGRWKGATWVLGLRLCSATIFVLAGSAGSSLNARKLPVPQNGTPANGTGSLARSSANHAAIRATKTDLKAGGVVHEQGNEKRTQTRDPFRPLLTSKSGATSAHPLNLPAGKAGLMVDAAQVQGTVRTSGEMIAVVSNAEGHVFFLHAGDRIACRGPHLRRHRS